MNEDRQLTIHYNNGPRVEVSFPILIKIPRLPFSQE